MMSKLLVCKHHRTMHTHALALTIMVASFMNIYICCCGKSDRFVAT